MENNENKKLIKDLSGCEKQYFQKGQKVVYEGKDAQIIQVKPLLVVKTGDRVICGALKNFLHV